ncbi:unnamed protein product [Ixodes hexagonus]
MSAKLSFPNKSPQEPGTSSEDFADSASCYCEIGEQPSTSTVNIPAYLQNRSQIVGIRDASSHSLSVTSGEDGTSPDGPTEDYSSDEASSHSSSVTPSDEDSSDEDGTGPDLQAAQAARNFAELLQGIVSEHVVVCKGDILVMLLKYVASNNMSFTGLTNLVKMVNSFFPSLFYQSLSTFLTRCLVMVEPPFTFTAFTDFSLLANWMAVAVLSSAHIAAGCANCQMSLSLLFSYLQHSVAAAGNPEKFRLSRSNRASAGCTLHG